MSQHGNPIAANLVLEPQHAHSRTCWWNIESASWSCQRVDTENDRRLDDAQQRVHLPS
jgi:hypothetical protein